MKLSPFVVLATLLATQPSFAAEQLQPVVPQSAALATALPSPELATLQARITELEQTPRLTASELTSRNRRLLGELAGQVRTQRQTMADFNGFVSWLSGSLEGYNKYLQASAVAANLIKVLPIPYAGQASMFTKFAAQGVASLNITSTAITRYLGTSQQFLTRYEALEKSPAPDHADVSALVKFADEQLLKDTADVRSRLSSTADLSTSVLAFLEGVNGYLGSADQYWAKTKAFVTRNEDAAKEKGYLSTSITGLRDRAGAFSRRLLTFNELTSRNEPLVRTVRVYDSLAAELKVPNITTVAK